jgi:hypothetical protein
MDATSEAAFLPLGCLPGVVLRPAVLLRPDQSRSDGRQL